MDRDVRMALDWQEMMGQDDAPVHQQMGQGFPGAATFAGEVDTNDINFGAATIVGEVDINDIDFGALFEFES